MRTHHLLFAFLLAAVPAIAQDDGFDDLFGDSLSGTQNNDMSDLKEAASGVRTKKGNRGGLKPKGGGKAGASKVQLIGAFAAERIVITKKEGCIPGGRGRIKITSVDVGEVPGKTPALAVCVKMSSRSNREMRVTMNIVDGRKKRIGRAEAVANFTGITRQDLVLDFPRMTVHGAGQYYVSLDIDGKNVGRLPLFVVNTSGGPAPVPAKGLAGAGDEL